MPDENQRDLAKQLAKQGDPKAIASAINHSLKPKGISADVVRDNGCIHVMLEGEQVPNHQKVLVNFIENGMKKLDVDSIYTVKVYGRQFGDDIPIWEDEVILKMPPEEPVNLEPDYIPPQSEINPDQFEAIDDDDNLIEYDYLIEDDIPEEDLPEEMIASDESSEDYDFDDENINHDEIDDRVETDYNPEEDDDYEDEGEIIGEEESKNRTFLYVLLLFLLALAALAGLHLSGIYPLPFLSSSSESEVDSANPEQQQQPSEATDNSTTPAENSSEPTETPTDPWAEGVRSANKAFTLSQSAQSRTDWEAAASEWKQAVEKMQQVPESSPNYQEAQNKVTEYGKNYQVALQKAADASN